MKLTKAVVAKLALPEGKSDHTVYDDDLRGFGLRLRAGGRRTWVAVYRIGARVRRVSIGDASAVAPDTAREMARAILAQADLGRDAQAEKIEERARAAVTLGAVADTYLLRAGTRQKPRSLAETGRYLRRSWAALHGLPLHRIERRQVAVRLAELATESGPVAANRARAALSALFSWAMREGLAEHNPVVGTNRPAAESARDRVLSTAELAALWPAAEGPGDFNAIVRLLLLTGQRREEVAAMRWTELDLDRGIWTLPRERTKNRRPHDVPLVAQVTAILAGLPRREGRELVFGEGRGGFSGWSQAKARLDARSGVAGWRIHDLRRTCVTGMAEIGIRPHVIEAVVNHVSGHRAGVAGVYNRATYAVEKRAALQAWADHLDALLGRGEPRVVALRA